MSPWCERVHGPGAEVEDSPQPILEKVIAIGQTWVALGAIDRARHELGRLADRPARLELEAAPGTAVVVERPGAGSAGLRTQPAGAAAGAHRAGPPAGATPLPVGATAP